MFVHAIRATYMLMKKDGKMLVHFHKFSVFVQLVWSIPCFSPMIFGMV